MLANERYSDKQSSGYERGDVLLMAALVLLCAALFLPSAFFRDLWPPDEVRYAQVAREMAESGQWLVPHLNYEIYPDKPPLFFWLVALSAKLLGGFSTIAAVLPSALAGIGTVILTYLLAKKMFRSRFVGFLAGVILATSVEFLNLSSMGRMDIALTFFETLSLFYFWRWHIEGRRAYLFPFYIGMALAVLVKGPVGLLPLPIALIYLATLKQGAKTRQMRLGLGLLVMAAIIACWLVPAAFAGGEAYWKEILGKQIFGRVHNSWSHRKPFYFFLQTFPADFLPWFALLPAALIRYGRERAERTSIETKFLVTWFLTIFIFFTLISGKRNVYIMPLYPACSLFLAKYLGDVISAGERKPVELKVCFALLFVAMLGFSVAVIAFRTPYKTPENQTLVLMASSCLAVVGVSGLISLRARTFKPALVITSCFMICTVLVATPSVIPFVNKYKSAMPLGRTINEVRKGTEQVGMYGFYRAQFSFYTGSRIETIKDAEQLQVFLEQPAGAFCIVQDGALRDVEGSLPEGTTSVGRFIVGHRTLIVLHNPPDDTSAHKVDRIILRKSPSTNR
jgi:4-amino-4-deoxy-L-arabinose transferase-like glycosyltransferase